MSRLCTVTGGEMRISAMAAGDIVVYDELKSLVALRSNQGSLIIYRLEFPLRRHRLSSWVGIVTDSLDHLSLNGAE